MQKLIINNVVKNIVKNKESSEEYFLEVDVQYPEKLHELHIDLPFFTRKKEN